jgi:hypothetical protein
MAKQPRCTECGDENGPFTRRGLCEDCHDRRQPPSK